MSSKLSVDTNTIESNSNIRNVKNYTSSGEKLKSHGTTYHDQILMSYVCTALLKERFNFNLTCEIDEGGKFDDVVIFYDTDVDLDCRLIQIKHKDNISKLLTRDHLLGKHRDHVYDLAIYFVSYIEIITKYNFEERFRCRIKDVVLHTNIDFNDVLRRDMEKYDDEILGTGEFYRFKADSNIRKTANVTLKKVFLNHVTDVRKKCEKSGSFMMKDIRDIEKNYLEHLETLTEDEIQNKIDLFLEAQKFHVKQPDGKELADIIKKKIKKYLKRYNLLNTSDLRHFDMTYTNLFHKIYMFHSEPKVEIVTREICEEWIKEASKNCLSVLLCFHRLNISKLSVSDFKINENSVDNLRCKLDNISSSYLEIVAGAGVDVTLIKLTWILKNNKYSLITEEQFMSSKKELKTEIEIEKIEYLIIRCKKEVSADIRMYANNILSKKSLQRFQILKNIILVSRLPSIDTCKRINDETGWQDLEERTQTLIRNEKKICIQGRRVPLSSIDISLIEDLIKNEILYAMVYTDTFELGQKLECGDESDFSNFIERRIYIHDRIDMEILNMDKDGHVFAINCWDEKEFERIKVSSCSQLVRIPSENPYRYFNKLCTDHQDKKVTWFRYKNGELFYVKGTSIETIRPFIIGNVSRSVDVRTASCVEDRTVLIVAEPGMGKSKLLSMLASRTIETIPGVLVAKINLNSCTNMFDELQRQGKTFEDRRSAIAFVINTQLRSRKAYRKFEFEFFNRHIEKSGKIVILLDSFDEIAPHYRIIVVDLIRHLQSLGTCQLWITSRSQEKRFLEEKLHVFAWSLVEFTEEDQRSFFSSYWKRRIDDRNMQEKRLAKFIDRMIVATSRSLRDKDTLMMGVPLQCKMLAEVYHDDFRDYYISKNDDCEQYLPDTLNILHLYEQFVEKKRFIYENDKLGRISSNTGNMLSSNEERNKFIKTHAYFGISSIFSDECLDEILEDSDRCKIRKYCHKVKNTAEKTGIVFCFERDKPKFIHKTFAEYFSAIWFFDRIKANGTSSQCIVEFSKRHFFGEEFELVRRFFDRLSARGRFFELVLNNDERKLKDFLRNNPTCYRDCGDFNRNSLHLCAAYESETVIQMLIDNQVNMTVREDLYGWKPVQYAYAVKNWTNVDLLIANDENDRALFDQMIEKKNILFKAVEKGLINLTRYMIKHGINKNITDNKNETLLHLAIKYDRFEMYKYLIDEAKMNMNIHLYGHSLAHFTANVGNLRILKDLIARGISIDDVNYVGQTPLHISCLNGNNKLCEYLINECEVNVDICDMKGNSVLHNAARYCDLSIVEYLISRGLNVNRTNKKGQSPLHISCFYKNNKVSEYLISTGEAKIDICDENDDSILHYAARYSDLSIVKYLISKGVNIDAVNNKGQTPLHISCCYKNDKVSEYFIVESKANLDICDNNGDSTLHYAVKYYDWIIVKELISRGLNIDAANNKGRTPLHISCFYKVHKVSEYLIDVSGASVNVCDENGNSILHYAVRYCDLNIVEKLISRGSNVDAVNNEGQTPLHVSYSERRSEISEYLIREGKASVDVCDRIGDSILHYAVKYCDLSAVKDLISRGLDVNTVNGEGQTPLHIACLQKKHEVSEYLITEGGANVNVCDNEGDSALHYMAFKSIHTHNSSFQRVFELLLESGIDCTFQNKKCKTALDLIEGRIYLADTYKTYYRQKIEQYTRAVNTKNDDKNEDT